MKLLLAGNLMNVMDVITTNIAITQNPINIQYEMNPIAKILMSLNWGWLLFAFIKIFGLIAFTLWYYFSFRNKTPRMTTLTLGFVFMFFTVCVISNLMSIYYGKVML